MFLPFVFILIRLLIWCYFRWVEYMPRFIQEISPINTRCKFFCSLLPFRNVLRCVPYTQFLFMLCKTKCLSCTFFAISSQNMVLISLHLLIMYYWTHMWIVFCKRSTLYQKTLRKCWKATDGLNRTMLTKSWWTVSAPFINFTSSNDPKDFLLIEEVITWLRVEPVIAMCTCVTSLVTNILFL